MSQYSDPSIDERIARRRARTAELKKKRKRQMMIQLWMIVLAVVLLAMVTVFAVHALSTGRRAGASVPDNAALSNEPDSSFMQVMQSTVNTPEASTSGTDASQTTQPEAGDDLFFDAEDPSDALQPDETEPGKIPEDRVLPATVGRYAETVIYVDPGRGYSDLGCTSDYLNGLHEQEINLDVAMQTAQLLTDYGFTVLMTHDTNEIPAGQPEDYVLDQYTRADMANHSGCAVYLSIHCDYFPTNPDVSGTRLYYCTDVEGSAAFAEALSEGFSQEQFAAPQLSGKDQNNSFIVTSQVTAPSVLVELGFVTNEADAGALCTDEHRTSLAKALARGVILYLGLEE